MARVIAVLGAAALAAGAVVAQGASKYQTTEATALEAVSDAWVACAAKALDGGHELLPMHAIDQARMAGAADGVVKEAEAGLMKPRPVGPTKDGAESGDLLAEARARAGTAVEPLVGLDPPPTSTVRHAEHLWRALEADPKNAKALAAYQKRTGVAVGAKDWAAVRAHVMRARELDPEGYRSGRYKAAEQALAKNGGIVVRGSRHPLQAYVVLPAAWSPKKKWPIFVAIVGANCAYERQLEELTAKAGRSPFILVVAMTLSNANDLPLEKLPYPASMTRRYLSLQTRAQRAAWDEQGLPGAIDEIRQRFSGDERFFMTGYSGGGFLTHYWLQHHSDQLVGACLSSANYAADLCEPGAIAPADGGCPVLIVSGSRDQAGPPRIFPQSDEAAKRLAAFGFTQVDRRHLENRDHEAFYELGLELLAKCVAKRKP
jgi:hypothetical protein